MWGIWCAVVWRLGQTVLHWMAISAEREAESSAAVAEELIGGCMANVEFREFEEKDFRASAGILGDTWFGDEPETERAILGGAAFADMMRRATYSQVACVDGVVTGVTLARAGDPDPRTAASWLRVAEGCVEHLRNINADVAERALASCRAENAIDAELLAMSGCDERYEIVLLICSEDARGLGLGKELLDRAEAYLRVQGAHEAFLYTDEGCTWGFYEHRGLRRAAELHPESGGDVPLLSGYYLYVEELV